AIAATTSAWSVAKPAAPRSTAPSRLSRPARDPNATEPEELDAAADQFGRRAACDSIRGVYGMGPPACHCRVIGRLTRTSRNVTTAADGPWLRLAMNGGSVRFVGLFERSAPCRDYVTSATERSSRAQSGSCGRGFWADDCHLPGLTDAGIAAHLAQKGRLLRPWRGSSRTQLIHP